MSSPSYIRPVYRLIPAILLLALGSWSAVQMWGLHQDEKLWGHWPMVLLLSVWTGLFTLFGKRFFSTSASFRSYMISMLGGLLLYLGFPPSPLTFFLLVGFIPLLYLEEKCRKSEQRGSKRSLILLTFNTFLIWNILSTFWVVNTSFLPGIFANMANAILMTFAFLLYSVLRKRVRPGFAFIVLASAWIGFEFYHHRWELLWPWLSLGNGLARWPCMAQWYEWTGIFGGSLWILWLNWLIYRLLMLPKGKKVSSGTIWKVALWFFIPLFLSLSLYWMRDLPAEDEVTIAVIQPNFEPHYEKFNISDRAQLMQFIQLSESVVNEETDFLLYPETSFRINLNQWNQEPEIIYLRRFLKQFPDLSLIAGMDTRVIFDDFYEGDQFTRLYIDPLNGDSIYWENHNTAIQMTSDTSYEIYYKSKLVPGAEFFPFKNLFPFMSGMVKDLGGSYSGLRTQEEREAFADPRGDAGPLICYESIFGEYVSGYVKEGADFLLIMTNDGWWDNTAGHKQHMYFASLRAIEQRKAIGRSANTGISCFVDAKGNISQKTKYGEEAAIVGKIRPNTVRTFYSRYGDYIGRLAILLLAGFVLISLVGWSRDKWNRGESMD